MQIPKLSAFSAVAALCAVFPAGSAQSSFASAPIASVSKAALREYEYAASALKVGNFHKAGIYFERAVHRLPQFPEAHLGLGHVAMGEKRFETALAEYETARDDYSRFGESLAEMRGLRYAEAQGEIGDLRDAISNMMKPIGAQVVPNWLEAEIAKREGRIRELESIEPPDKFRSSEAPGEVFFHIGNALFRLDRVDDAIDAWQRCADRSGKFALVHNNLAVALWKKGEIERAQDELKRAEDLGMQVSSEFKADLARSATRVQSSRALTPMR